MMPYLKETLLKKKYLADSKQLDINYKKQLLLKELLD